MGRISSVLIFGFLFVSVGIGAAFVPLGIYVFHFPVPSGYQYNFNWWTVTLIIIGAFVGVIVWVIVVLISFALLGVSYGIASIFRKSETKKERTYSVTEPDIMSDTHSKDAVNSNWYREKDGPNEGEVAMKKISEKMEKERLEEYYDILNNPKKDG